MQSGTGWRGASCLQKRLHLLNIILLRLQQLFAQVCDPLILPQILPVVLDGLDGTFGVAGNHHFGDFGGGGGRHGVSGPGHHQPHFGSHGQRLGITAPGFEHFRGGGAQLAVFRLLLAEGVGEGRAGGIAQNGVDAVVAHLRGFPNVGEQFNVGNHGWIGSFRL